MGFFEKLKNGLKKTKDSMMGRIESLLHSFSKIDEDLFEELEETLILCDIGVTTSEKICDKLRQKVKQEGVKEPEKIKDMLKEIITEMLGEDQKLDMSTTPSVILVIGVNGVGKTSPSPTRKAVLAKQQLSASLLISFINKAKRLSLRRLILSERLLLTSSKCGQNVQG